MRPTHASACIGTTLATGVASLAEGSTATWTTRVPSGPGVRWDPPPGALGRCTEMRSSISASRSASAR
eukprot:scaffold107269_cov57-Phaeocystis_antarctica.AAC.1